VVGAAVGPGGVGALLGADVGYGVGAIGASVGSTVGSEVGTSVGTTEGRLVGKIVGAGVGAGVGYGVSAHRKENLIPPRLYEGKAREVRDIGIISWCVVDVAPKSDIPVTDKRPHKTTTKYNRFSVFRVSP